MVRLISRVLRRLFSRRLPEGPCMYELTCCHAGRYEGLVIYILQYYDDGHHYVEHVTTEDGSEVDFPPPAVFRESGKYPTPRAAYLAAKMRIDELCGFGEPNPAES